MSEPKIVSTCFVPRGFWWAQPLERMEHEALQRGEDRIKFRCVKIGQAAALSANYSKQLQDLHSSCELLEKLGYAPVCPDGKVAGNGAIRCGEAMLVSRSGKSAGEPYSPDNYCFVERFDEETWTAYFRANGSDTRPSSDTPLLWAALFGEFGWTEQPCVALHGHAFASDEAAEMLGAPISREETLFSTPADRGALVSLFKAHPYPRSSIFIRRSHGFFLLAQSIGNGNARLLSLRSRHDTRG